MRFDCNGDVQVARRAAAPARGTLARKLDRLPGRDAAGDGRLNGALAGRIPFAAADLAGVLYNLPGTAAMTAGGHARERAEDGALLRTHLAGAAAGRAGLPAFALMRAGALAVRADLFPAVAYGAFAAKYRL